MRAESSTRVITVRRPPVAAERAPQHSIGQNDVWLAAEAVGGLCAAAVQVTPRFSCATCPLAPGLALGVLGACAAERFSPRLDGRDTICGRTQMSDPLALGVRGTEFSDAQAPRGSQRCRLRSNGWSSERLPRTSPSTRFPSTLKA